MTTSTPVSYLVARNDLNTLLPRPMTLGHIWVRFLSRFQYPIARVQCRLVGGGREWPLQDTSLQGEVYWGDVPLDAYRVTLTLGSLSAKQVVPWLRAKDKVHEQRLVNVADLLGPASSPHGTQVRLIGLGYDCGTPDGNLGSPETMAAIKQFQTDHYSTVNGMADSVLRGILYETFGG